MWGLLLKPAISSRSNKNMADIGKSCFWMTETLKIFSPKITSPIELLLQNESFVGTKMCVRISYKITHFVSIRQETWPPWEYIVSIDLLHCTNDVHGMWSRLSRFLIWLRLVGCKTWHMASMGYSCFWFAEILCILCLLNYKFNLFATVTNDVCYIFYRYSAFHFVQNTWATWTIFFFQMLFFFFFFTFVPRNYMNECFVA